MSFIDGSISRLELTFDLHYSRNDMVLNWLRSLMGRSYFSRRSLPGELPDGTEFNAFDFSWRNIVRLRSRDETIVVLQPSFAPTLRAQRAGTLQFNPCRVGPNSNRVLGEG